MGEENKKKSLSFWDELKRRHVFRAATLYVISAWLMIQIITTILPIYDAEPWVIKTITTVLIIGFPIAIILAWIYEMSPQGMIKTNSAISDENPLPAHKRKPMTSNWVIIVLLSVVIIQTLFLSDIFKTSDSIESVPITVIDVVNETNEEELSSISGLLITSLQNSNHLAPLTRTRLLDIAKQIGKGGITPIDDELGLEISKQAQVPLMLQASINSFGDTYTIDLKVLDVDKNVYIFTQTEKSESKSQIPDMIDDVTFKLRDHLEDEPIDFDSTKKVAEETTSDMMAYYHYFKGEEFFNTWKIDEAFDSYQKAIDIDSNFALAHYGQFYLHWYGLTGVSREVRNKKLEKVLTLIDRLPKKEQDLTIGFKKYLLDRSLEGYVDHLNEISMKYKDEKEIFYQLGDRYYHTNLLNDYDTRTALAISNFERAYEIDPLYNRAADHLFRAYFLADEYQKAFEFADQNMEKIAKDIDALAMYAITASKTGQLDKMNQHLEMIPDSIVRKWRKDLALIHLDLFQENIDVESIKAYTITNKNRRYQIYNLYNLLGMHKTAIATMDTVLDQMIKFNAKTAINYMIKAMGIINTTINQNEWNNKKITDYVSKEKEAKFDYNYYYIQNGIVEKLEELKNQSIDSKYSTARINFIEAMYSEDVQKINQSIDQLKSFDNLIWNRRIHFTNLKLLAKENRWTEMEDELDKAFLWQNRSYGFQFFEYDETLLIYPYLLYYKARILDAKNKTAEAIKIYEKFLILWKYADEDIPELIEAKKRYDDLISK